MTLCKSDILNKTVAKVLYKRPIDSWDLTMIKAFCSVLKITFILLKCYSYFYLNISVFYYIMEYHKNNVKKLFSHL